MRGRVVLGVCGSIAAYKACEILRGLVTGGAEARVVLTPNASRFVAPLTVAALSRAEVHQDPWDPRHWEMAHLSLASWAGAVLVAPASADFLSRLAAGGAGGLLESLILSTRAPVALAPAMDAEMWEHPATRANVERLRGFGYQVWGPEAGPLASGRVGPGRLLDPGTIVKLAFGLLAAKAGQDAPRGGRPGESPPSGRGAGPARRSRG
jgi:phosphopantothenoylcysteine decarboxylase/phosphopantothenate--cysteine ligase